MQRARAEEARRLSLGLPKSRLRIPTEADSDEVHREFYVKRTEVKKIEEDSREGYVVRVEQRPAVQLDNLDPELLTGRPLTEKEAYWVKKKQARRAGPRSSSWLSTMSAYDQYKEYISFTEKFRKLVDHQAPRCSECGSRMRGTSIITPLSRRAVSRLPAHIVDKSSHLCIGCARLFRCVNNCKDKIDMINWIIARQVPPASAHEPDDQA